MKYALHRANINEVVSELPDLVPVETGNAEATEDSLTLFLCALGFEDRCLTAPEYLSSGQSRFDMCVWFRYATNSGENEANRTLLLDYLDTIADRTTAIDVDAVQCSQSLRSLIDSLCVDPLRPPSVVLDVSAMSGYLIMVTMAVLLERDVRLQVIYSEAETYYPAEDEFHEAQLADDYARLQLEDGVSDVFVPRELAGYQADSLPDCVFLLPSFGRGRIRAALGQIDTALATDSMRLRGESTVWFLGRPHYEENNWRQEAVASINDIPAESNVRLVSTFDYRQTLSELEAAFSVAIAEHRVSLVFAGSKMQAVGASLFCRMRPEVRVVLGVPREYKATHYSRGTRQIWRLDFASTGNLTQLLSTVGTLDVRRLES